MKVLLCASFLLGSLLVSCSGGGGGSAASAETEATFALSESHRVEIWREVDEGDA